MMAMSLHQLLLLVGVTALMLVVNLPCCRSQCDITAARRQAQKGPGQKMSPGAWLSKTVARRAARKAGVKQHDVVEAYYLNHNALEPNVCMLFNAWSKDCVSHLMQCVASASSLDHRNIHVDCAPVYLVEMSVKSGGRVYLSRDSNSPVVSSHAADVKKNAGKQLLIIGCRLWNNVSTEVRESKKRFCVSLVDPQRPGWFIRHYNYYLQLESETSPQNAPLFDQDATFILIPDKFWPEFFALESYNYPDHYVYVTGDGRMRISKYAQKDEFHNSASFALTDHFVKPNYPCSSCKEIQDLSYMQASSGEYSIKTRRGTILDRVYCEMGLNGGGYTFISPKDLPTLSNDEVQAMCTDNTSFLMRVRRIDSTQPYGTLMQLPQYQADPLKLSLSDFYDYTEPVNVKTLGPNFLYFGFIPASKARNRNKQGIQINGKNLTFTNCDSNPNSYMALFPNIAERTPTKYLHGGKFSFCDDIVDALSMNPSCRVMPARYFMFLEMHYGGCGCYTQTDRRQSIGTTLNAAIGFR